MRWVSNIGIWYQVKGQGEMRTYFLKRCATDGESGRRA